MVQYISEFGFSEPFENERTELFQVMEDSARTSKRRDCIFLSPWCQLFIHADYLMTYSGEALLAIHEDGIPLAGAFTWGRGTTIIIVMSDEAHYIAFWQP